jgi:predicted phosphodiesterase
MLTIVAVADTHLYHDELELPAGDILVHAGDLTRGGTLAELERAAAWLRGLPYAHKIVVAGNHERCLERAPAEARALLDGLDYLQDGGVVRCGLRFWGSPWQPEFHQWAFNLPRGAALAERWAQVPEGTDVLVTHGPPRGYGDDLGGGAGSAGWQRARAGCEDLLARVRAVRPLLHLYGHIHQGRGHWRDGGSLLVNVTTDECMKPATAISVDVAGRRAEVVG